MSEGANSADVVYREENTAGQALDAQMSYEIEATAQCNRCGGAMTANEPSPVNMAFECSDCGLELGIRLRLVPEDPDDA